MSTTLDDLARQIVTEFSRLDGRIGSLEDRIGALETRINSLASGIGMLDRKVDDVAAGVRAMNTDMAYLRNLRNRVQ